MLALGCPWLFFSSHLLRSLTRSTVDRLGQGQLFGLRAAEMERVPKVLQFPVIIKGNRPSLFEPEPLQKFDFLPGGIAAEGSIVKEFFEPRLFVEGWVAFLFHKLQFLNVPRDHSFI